MKRAKNNVIIIKILPVAQLDNAADSDSEERGFESLRAGQNFIYALIRDSNPERAQGVKKNSVGHCFLALWCADGYCLQSKRSSSRKNALGGFIPSGRPEKNYSRQGSSFLF